MPQSQLHRTTGAKTEPRGADRVVAALKAHDVRVVFALSGNHIMVLFDALIGSGIELIHTRDEGACVHMADAYARLTGQVGVALVTGGQGHTNAVAALPTALSADSSVLLLSGHAPLAELGRGAFQELAQARMAEPVTKASWTAAAGCDLALEVARAISIATSGRPGPVHVSLPTDLLEGAFASSEPIAPVVRPPLGIDADTLARLNNALRRAERPVVLAGPMLASLKSREKLRHFAERTAVPAIVMESPRGLADPSLGAFAEALREADLIVLLGKPLDFTLKFGASPFIAPTARWAVIDPDAAMIERVQQAFPARIAAAVQADVDAALTALTDTGARRSQTWASQFDAALTYRPQSWATERGAPGALHPIELCRAVQAALDTTPQSVFIADGGEIGQWAQAGISAPRRVINGVAGSIGASVPFALAARVVERTAPVIAMLGDGTFGFHMAEIDTAVRHHLPVVLVIGNDRRWNAEHQIQLKMYGADRIHGCDLLPTRYDQVAIALGGHGELVTSGDGLAPALQRALASNKPAVVNVMIDGLPAPMLRRGAA